MKRFFVALSAVLVSLSISAQSRWGDQGNGTYINPILCADYSDPDVIRVGEKYFMVASDFHFLGMQLLESDDMVNWTLVNQLYDRFDMPGWDTNSHYSGGSWAPSIRYHEGRFYVYFCTPDEGLFMTSTADPYGKWEPLHCVKSIPKWEDPCPFWDEDGKAYLVRSQHGAGPIIVHRLSDDGRELLDDGFTVYTGPIAEGPKVHKLNGYYYISIPEGGVGTGWQTILRSKNIYGPYEKRVVLEQGPTDINGCHQGSMVDTPDGKWAFFHFQQNGSIGRVVHLQPMTWSEDGWPVIGVDIDRNGIGNPVSVWTKLVAGDNAFAPASSDDFSSSALSYQWQFNHNPVDGAWRVDPKRHVLQLDALESSTFRTARNTVTQKVMGFKSQATVTLDVSEIAEGQRCGLAAMGHMNMMLGVRRENGKTELYNSDDKTETVLCQVKKNVILRIDYDMDAQRFQFSYSLDGKKFVDAGDPFYLRFGFWKGARTALYSYNVTGADGRASFSNFVYVHDGPSN